MRGASDIKVVPRISVIIIVCLFELSTGLPAEQPTKFTLSTGDVSSPNVASGVTSPLDRGRVSVFAGFEPRAIRGGSIKFAALRKRWKRRKLKIDYWIEDPLGSSQNCNFGFCRNC